MSAPVVPFAAVEPGARDRVGGKGLALAELARAGLPVPPGFCVTADAHRRHGDDPAALAADLAAAYRDLGEGVVAVRSSATAEDGRAASFAGQQETVLGVAGPAALVEAVGRCWASLGSERARAYRRKQGVAEGGLAMAVVVQRLVEAEAAGVLFTRDPTDAAGRRMLVEASWGLGESVVSGRVTPDRFHLDRDTGAVLEEHVAVKTRQVTSAGESTVPSDRQAAACLTPGQLRELAELGRRVEAFYGEPRDVEWAFAGGRVWLLQARPITAGGAAEREAVRREEVAALAAKAEPGGTVWARFNLAEVLPDPTPMTWAVVRRLMAGRGGFGLMYRDLGFDPDPALDEDGVFDLVCGRPYCNLSREARLHDRAVPWAHPFAALKADPSKAFYPQPTLDTSKAGLGFWLRFPLVLWRTSRAQARQAELVRTFAAEFRDRVVPEFLREVGAAERESWEALDDRALLARLEHWIDRTLVRFARESLKPTALAAVLLAKVERALGKEAAREKIMGVRPDPETDVAGAVRALGEGRMGRDEFLTEFGHRGPKEMELAEPRWGEPGVTLPAAGGGPADRAPHRPGVDATDSPDLALLHTYLGLRETAKHHLLRGYALIRRILLELDRRHALAGGVFFLTPNELPALIEGRDFAATIAARKRRRALALSLDVPPVIFSDDLEAVGRHADVTARAEYAGTPLSAGVAEAAALVLETPDAAAAPAAPYILVCPSTDPAWVPLFAGAAGLVMETGGVLSHGAIVAREFGLPAVAGLPGVVRQLKTGQRLRVDGGRGLVHVT